MRFINELRRRHVFRAAIGYLIVSWITIQVADIMLFNFGAPAWVFRTLFTCLVIGFPLVLRLSWAFNFSSEGIRLEAESNRVSPTRRRLRKFVAITLVVGSLITVFLL